jgi:small subunit ribosomal protein S20
MANLKASKKYIPINKRNRERNVKFKSALKTRIKKALDAIASNSKEKIDIVKLALKAIAKVRQKGIIHKNYANRMKSKLSLKLNEEPKVEVATPAVKKKTVKAVAAKKPVKKAVAKKAPAKAKAKTEEKATTEKKVAPKKAPVKAEKKAEVKETKKD